MDNEQRLRELEQMMIRLINKKGVRLGTELLHLQIMVLRLPKSQMTYDMVLYYEGIVLEHS